MQIRKNKTKLEWPLCYETQPPNKIWSKLTFIVFCFLNLRFLGYIGLWPIKYGVFILFYSVHRIQLKHRKSFTWMS